jgi:alpha-D-ribose 1-methylphosphonate 5-triphosphate synthase subunit PhnH
LSLSGPGIAARTTLAAEPLPLDFRDRLSANRALFPRGIDVILVSPEAVAALPRSVVAERG